MTIDDVICEVLSGSRQTTIKFMNVDHPSVRPFSRPVCSPSLMRKNIQTLIETLGLKVFHDETIKDLANLTTRGELTIRPQKAFRAPIFYDMVMVHEIAHELYHRLRIRSGVSRWVRNNIDGVRVRRPALALEEIVVEATAVFVTDMLVPNIQKKYFGPSFYYIRERLADLAVYGVPWKKHRQILEYCLEKSLKLAIGFVGINIFSSAKLRRVARTTKRKDN